MKYVIFLIFVLAAINTKSQDFKIPNYKTKEDYINKKDNVIEVCDWLISNSIDTKNRKEANAYLMKWIAGSPIVSVGISEYVLKLTDKNPDFLVLFIAGWIKNDLVKGKKSDLESNYQAILILLEYYQSNESINDSDLDKLIKMKDKDKLRSWIEKQI